MKKLNLSIILVAFATLSLIGCSESTQPPVAPTNGTQISASTTHPAQGLDATLDNKGPVVHRIQGSANGTFEGGKNMVWTITGHEYADGSFDGQYEVNAANALGESYQKWHGKVVFLKVYGNLCVVGGEETGANAGWYDVFFMIDNGKNGQATLPDQTSLYIYAFNSLTNAQMWWNKAPSELMDALGVLPVERGNITID